MINNNITMNCEFCIVDKTIDKQNGDHDDNDMMILAKTGRAAMLVAILAAILDRAPEAAKKPSLLSTEA